MRRGRWEPSESFEIPQTPLIDIIFILIVFFLVATTFYSEERDLKVTLPEGDQGDAISREARRLVINVRTGGVVVVDNALVDDEELAARLQAVGDRPEVSVEIRGDAGARHGRIMQVMNLCRKAGVSRYSLTQRIVRETE